MKRKKQNTAAFLRPDLLGTAPGYPKDMMDMVRCQMMSDYPWWDKKRLHPLAGLAGRFQSLSGMKHHSCWNVTLPLGKGAKNPISPHRFAKKLGEGTPTYMAI